MIKNAIVCLICMSLLEMGFAADAKPIRKLTYDAAASVVELFNAGEKLRIQVIPQNEFLSRVRIENRTEGPLTVRLPKAVAAVHSVPQKADDLPNPRVRTAGAEGASDEPAEGTGQAVVGSFGPLDAEAKGFPHQSDEGDAFTIPAGRSVQILLHSACAEHGKRPPISRMTYELKPLAEQVENETLQKIARTYNPAATDSLAFQAAVWHLANGLSWETLAQKTVKRGGQTVPYFTRQQLATAQKLIESAER